MALFFLMSKQISRCAKSRIVSRESGRLGAFLLDVSPVSRCPFMQRRRKGCKGSLRTVREKNTCADISHHSSQGLSHRFHAWSLLISSNTASSKPRKRSAHQTTKIVIREGVRSAFERNLLKLFPPLGNRKKVSALINSSRSCHRG